MNQRLFPAVLAVLLLSISCASDTTVVAPSTSTTSSTSPSTTSAPTSTAPTTTITAPASQTDHHTAPRLDGVAEFMTYARTGVANQAVVKFSIPDIINRDAVEWMDSNFYELHDEWYWFQLLNGRAIPGIETAPVDGLSFDSIDEVYTWAENLSPQSLPLDLAFVGSTEPKRLHSPRFYELALHSNPRALGVGSLVRFSTGAGDRWLIELEYTDDVTPEDVALFFERLAPTLPTDIAGSLEWVVRSPHQAMVADEMTTRSLPYGDRVVRYSELVPRGDVGVYNPGVAAGRLLLVEEGGAQLTDAKDTDIVIIADVPDWLPPASALITSSPQTPLAHVNLLARNRGIPNASLAGLLDDAEIRQAARVRAPAIIRASGVDSLEVVLITNAEYDTWRSKLSRSPIAVPPVNLDDAPLVLSLEEIAGPIESETDVEAWRPLIGGKSAGYLALLGADGVTTPEAPLAITVRPYLEHLASVQDALTAILNDPDFASSARTRFLLLEGPEDFEKQYPDEGDIEFADAFAGKHPPGTLLGDVLEAGGFTGYFRDAPLTAETLAELTATLEDHFDSFASTQGLRFRSSSSVEDIEGFSGAGLYDSNTGFLEPETQPDEDDHNKTIERTIKKTWASYWSFEAFEERRREQVDHTSGAMGVLVHARFDDDLERNNGVATFTLLPDNAANAAVVEINVQLGAESVANPDPLDGDLPEVTTVTIDRDGQVTIDRVERSTLSPTSPVLGDDGVRELVDQLEAVALLWRDRVNNSLSPEQQVQTLTLDYEFKTMEPGWPARADGTIEPGRLIVKQARSLDPGLRGIPDEVLELDVRRDVLARARQVTKTTCDTAESVEVLTDPLLVPDVGYGDLPLIVGSADRTLPGCETTVLYSTADQYLLELLDTKSSS